MVRIWIHTNIAKLADGRTEWNAEFISGRSVGEILKDVFADRQQLLFGLIDETGTLRKHINIFIGDSDIKRLNGLDSAVADGCEISIFTAVSGG